MRISDWSSDVCSSDLRRVGIGVDHPKFQLRGLADQILQFLRIVEPRHLDDDAVVAFADDRRFARAERIDAAVDDVARRVPRAAARLLLTCPGRGHHDACRLDGVDVPVATAGQRHGARFSDHTNGRGAWWERGCRYEKQYVDAYC